MCVCVIPSANKLTVNVPVIFVIPPLHPQKTASPLPACSLMLNQPPISKAWSVYCSLYTVCVSEMFLLFPRISDCCKVFYVQIWDTLFTFSVFLKFCLLLFWAAEALFLDFSHGNTKINSDGVASSFAPRWLAHLKETFDSLIVHASAWRTSLMREEFCVGFFFVGRR